MSDLNLARDKTISDFGDQWTRHTENVGHYASVELLEDITAPFLNRADILGKRCADIGSGTGRIVRMLAAAGAAHVTAIEPSRAFEVLKENTRDIADKVNCLNVRGDELPAGNFDLVVSLGVIHHIPEPLPVLQAAWRALKPGGRLLIWVYGHEGARSYTQIFVPLRAITRRLPVAANEAIAAALYPFTMLYGWTTRLLPFLPLSRYMRDVYLRFEPSVRRLVIVDQLNPQWAKYYRKEEIEALVRSAGFAEIASHHRHGYSWTVIGTRLQ